MTGAAEYARALEETWTGLADAVTGLTPAQWDLPTDLPGWTVKDNVSHVVGLELLLLGEPFPTHELPADLPHVRNDAGRFMEVAVDLRRPASGESVLAELRDVTARRLKVLRSLDDASLDEEVLGFFGNPTKLGWQLGIRTFDCWVHEQDVRRALGLPRSLTSTAAAISRRRLLLALTGLARDVPAVAGRVVVVETRGEVPSIAALSYGSPPRYVDADAPDAAVRITLDFETFLLLGTGRRTYDDVAGSVEIAGDIALGEELVRHFTITP